MVLKYLLMGHHLIPGVSGMSGTLCNLLGRGHLQSFQPAARSGSQRASLGSVLLPPALWCWVLGLLFGSSGTAAEPRTGIPRAQMGCLMGYKRQIAADSDVWVMVMMNALLGLFGSMIPGIRPHRRGQQSPLLFADMHFAGREAEAWPEDAANPNPEGAESCCAAGPRLPLGKSKPREELEKGDRRML